MSGMYKALIAVALMALCCGCGHTSVSTIGLLSDGDLESRTIPSVVDGPVLVGEDVVKVLGAPSYRLSTAVRNALKGSEYDTIVDAEVTTTTGLWVWSNSIMVKGKGVKSTSLPKEGGAQ